MLDGGVAYNPGGGTHHGMPDRANGFCFVNATVADIGANAQLGVLLYLLSEPRYPAAPENMLTAIA